MWYVRSGSKVTGPFNEEQLRVLRKRGQFAPIHQISSDRIRWESAASLVKLIDGNGQSQQSQVTDSRATDSSAGENSNANPDQRWYYLSDQQKLGPFTAEMMYAFARNGTINGQTMVCARGESQWTTLSEHPTLSDAVPSNWRPFIITCIFAFTVLAGIAFFVFPPPYSSDSKPEDHGTNKESDPPAEKPSDGTSRPNGVISGVTDNKAFAKVVGYVLGTYVEPELDGTLGNKVGQGHGTAFAITSDGYMMTNRHVAVMGVEELVKKSQQKEWAELADAYAQKAQTTTEAESRKKMVQYANICTAKARIFGKPETVINAKVKIYIDQLPFDAKVVHVSERYDMAILKIDRKEGLFFGLSNGNEPEQGIEVNTLGFPGIANAARSVEDVAIQKLNREARRTPEESLLPHHLKFSRTNGTISRVVEDSSRIWTIEHTVQTFPGNSGGPIFDRHGTVIGLHYGGQQGETGGKLNFALSTGQFKKELDQFVGAGIHWTE